MNEEKNKKFIKGVEELVNVIDVGSLHFIAFFNYLLPVKIQRKLVEKSVKKISYMGFIVEPYSSFLFYEIKDIEAAEKMIPDNFKLIKTSVFDGEEPKYYCIFGSVNVKTSSFLGTRMEFYIIAEDKNTGLLTWLIVDYDTNTIGYDNKRGIVLPNAEKAIITTDYNGKLYVDIRNDQINRKLVYEIDLNNGLNKSLNQRLWLEGNLSIGYGRNLSLNDSTTFSLKFNEKEVEKAYEISNKNIKIESNSWFSGLFKDKVDKVVVFPYAQHFISDSPGFSSNIKNKVELKKAVENLDFNKINVFSSKSFRKMFILGSLFSTILILILLIIIIL